MSSEMRPARTACRLYLDLKGDSVEADRLDCRCGSSSGPVALGDVAARCAGRLVAVVPAAAFARRRIGRGGEGAAWLMLAASLRVRPRDLSVTRVREAGGGHALIALPAAVLERVWAALDRAGIAPLHVEPGETAAPGRGAVARRLAGRGPFLAGAGMVAAAALALAALPQAERSGQAPDAAVGEAQAPAFAALGEAQAPAFAALVPDVALDEVGAPGAAAETAALDAPPAPWVETQAPQTVLPQPPEAAPLALVRAEPPAARPAAPPILARLEEAVVPAAMASRSVPPEIRDAALAAVRDRAAEDPRVASTVPLARPDGWLGALPEAGGGPTVEASTGSDPVSEASVAGLLRPLPRAALPVLPARAVGETAGPAVELLGRPLARPVDPARIVEAALRAAEVPAAVVPATSSAPAGLRPEPRGLLPPPEVPRATPGAVHTSPQGAPVQAAPSPARPQAQPAVPRQPAPAQSQPAPAPPQQAARVAPSPPPVPQQQAVPLRGPLTLIGVFGTSSQRHALVQLPGGAIQRVRAGESVGGVQIAAVDTDSVRVRAEGREGVLRLPE